MTQAPFPDSRFVDADGVPIHTRAVGDPDAPTTLLLLHGFGASTFSWRDQFPPLARVGRVIAFDRPGFGFTGRPVRGAWPGANPYTMSANADQAIAVLDAYGVERAVLVGHSAGAAVAVLAASAHPQRVEALVLEAPAVFRARTVAAPISALLRSGVGRAAGPALLRRIIGRNWEKFIASAYADPAFATPDVIEGYWAPLRERDWDRALWELIAAPRSVSAVDAMNRVAVPTLVVASRADTFVPFEDSARVADAISGARFVEATGSGHLPHEETPAWFADLVTEFVATLR